MDGGHSLVRDLVLGTVEWRYLPKAINVMELSAGCTLLVWTRSECHSTSCSPLVLQRSVPKDLLSPLTSNSKPKAVLISKRRFF